MYQYNNIIKSIDTIIILYNYDSLNYTTNIHTYI